MDIDGSAVVDIDQGKDLSELLDVFLGNCKLGVLDKRFVLCEVIGEGGRSFPPPSHHKNPTHALT